MAGKVTVGLVESNRSLLLDHMQTDCNKTTITSSPTAYFTFTLYVFKLLSI